jgi:hypothetical protein
MRIVTFSINEKSSTAKNLMTKINAKMIIIEFISV